MAFARFLLFVGLVCLLAFVNGHNYLIDPTSRGDQRDTQTGCRYGGEGNPTCAGPCDRKVSQMSIPAISVNRGQVISVSWYRHTHPGGFIRFAWSPTSSSDLHASFDSHVDKIVCKETGGCGPSDPSNPSGGTNGVDCGTTITVPTYLTNGAWTLQWAYFGGWYNAGDYYACVDYNIVGGPTGTQGNSFFVGGDYTYPNQNKCLFYSTNALHVCTVEPCLNGTFPPGDQSGAPLGYGGTTPFTTGHQTSTTHAKTSGAITSAKLTSTSSSTSTSTSSSTTTSTSSRSSTTTTSTSSRSSSTTTSTSTSTSGHGTSGSGAMCYLPGTPNINGTILSNPPYCGKNAKKARCADGQCCSKYGFCGPIPDSNGNYFEDIDGEYQQVTYETAVPLYCNRNQGDYRKVPCSSLNNKDDESSASGGVSITFNFLLLVSAIIFVTLRSRFC